MNITNLVNIINLNQNKNEKQRELEY